MSWSEIILGVLMIVTGVPAIEEVLGQAILDNSAGNPFYTGIWISVKFLPFLGILVLLDGIRRKLS